MQIELSNKYGILAILLTWGRIHAMISDGWCRGGRWLWCERVQWRPRDFAHRSGVRVGIMHCAIEFAV